MVLLFFFNCPTSSSISPYIMTFNPNDPNAHFPIHSQPPNFQPAFTAPHRRARLDDSPRRRSHPSPRSSQERHTHLPLFPPLLHTHPHPHSLDAVTMRSVKGVGSSLGMAIMDSRGHSRSRSERGLGRMWRACYPCKGKGRLCHILLEQQQGTRQ